MVYLIHISKYREEILLRKARRSALRIAHSLVKDEGISFGQAQKKAWIKIRRSIGFKDLHYIGWVKHGKNLERRLQEHRSGRGAKILQAANALGISWEVVRTWEGANEGDERRIKNRKETPMFCPICTPGALRRDPLDRSKIRKSDLQIWEDYWTDRGFKHRI